ncbi:MAG: ubiquinol-cytochrome C chaperone family protein [Alphaproteobacteria bacterium]
MFLSRLLISPAGRARRAAAVALYTAAVAQARQPVFYRADGFAVADSVDGRFDLIALHVGLVLLRCHEEGPALDELSRRVSAAFVDDMDISLREMGAGDMGVAPRMRRMARAFYGRLDTYGALLRQSPPGLPSAALADALWRNIWRGGDGDHGQLPAAAALAAYAVAARDALRAWPAAQLAAGKLRLPSPDPFVPALAPVGAAQ